MGETIVLVVAISLMVIGCALVCMINAGTIRNATTASLVGLVAFILFCVAGATFCFGSHVVDEGAVAIETVAE